MSYAGHVLAMIQRIKEHEAMRKRRSFLGGKKAIPLRQRYVLPEPTAEQRRRSRASNKRYFAARRQEAYWGWMMTTVIVLTLIALLSF